MQSDELSDHVYETNVETGENGFVADLPASNIENNQDEKIEENQNAMAVPENDPQ